MCRVRIRKGQLAYFRKKARATKKEVLAYLVGKVVSPELTIVEYVAYTQKYATQTECEVQWFGEEYDNVKKEAEERGLRIIGDIHSHPNWWPVPSPTDFQGQFQEGHRITGICSVMNGKTKVYFWIPESSLPCAVEYIDGK